MAYAGSSDTVEFSLYAPGPGTLSLDFFPVSRVEVPKPNLGDDLLIEFAN